MKENNNTKAGNSVADDTLKTQNAAQNSTESSTDNSKIEDFEKADDFLEYDDTTNSNISDNDPIAESNETLNDNSTNQRPTFNRTYEKNTADDVETNTEDSGKFDGTIEI